MKVMLVAAILFQISLANTRLRWVKVSLINAQEFFGKNLDFVLVRMNDLHFILNKNYDPNMNVEIIMFSWTSKILVAEKS